MVRGTLPVAFHEVLCGPFALGIEAPRLGSQRGRAAGTRLVADLEISLDDAGGANCRTGRIAGTIKTPGLAAAARVADGDVDVYIPDSAVGMKEIRYDMPFRGDDGRRYRLLASKFIRPGRRGWREHVTAYARVVVEAPDDDSKVAGPGTGEPLTSRTVGAGILRLNPWHVIALLRSVRATGLSHGQALRRFVAWVRREAATPTAIVPT